MPLQKPGSGAPSPCVDAVLCVKGSTRGLGSWEWVPHSTHGTNWSELFQLMVIEVISDQQTPSQADKEKRPEVDLGSGHSGIQATPRLHQGLLPAIARFVFLLLAPTPGRFSLCGGKMSACSCRLVFSSSATPADTDDLFSDTSSKRLLG